MKKPSAASLVLFGFSLGLFTSANASTLGSAVFPDVPSGSYFDSAVGDMYNAGIITGYSDGKFGPNDYVTRGQVAVMMQRFLHYTGGSVAKSSRSSSTSSSSSSEESSSSSSSSSSSVEPTNTEEGSFRFTTGSYKVDEDEGIVTINVIRYGGNAGSVTVEYETEDGSASDDSDYQPVSGKLTFADGKTTATFDVEVNDDNEAEDNETIILKLFSPGGGASIGTPNTATLTIVDNDEGDGTSVDPENSKGVFTFSASEYEVAEDMDEILITVRRAGASGEASVKFATVKGTADNSYYDDNSGTLTFGDGETERTFIVNISDNSDTNGNKTINLKLSEPTGGATLGSQSTATLIIVDDEIAAFGNGRFRLDESEYSVTEGESVIITIDRLGGSKGSVDLVYETQNVLAKAGEDYTEVSGTLTFKEGESQKKVVVPTTDDNKSDPRETFKFKLVSVDGGATIETPSTGTITIE